MRSPRAGEGRLIARKISENPRRRDAPPGSGAPGSGGHLSAGALALLLAVYLGAALVVYGPALDGPFVSDDIHYVAANPYVHELSVENVLTILKPRGAATIAVVNYSPAQLLLHGLAWQLFGSDTAGHHTLNVVLHALVSVLFAALLAASGVPLVAALVGSAFFLLHPANVEAVAWISQLKTTLAMALTLAALLAHARRPALGAGFFGASLLAKAQAAVALPVAFLLERARGSAVRWRWLALWCVVFAAYGLVELTAHQRSGAAEATLHGTPLVLLRTIAGLALRYLVMASTSLGVSAFHEPDPAYSWLDPWWLVSVPVLALLGWRLVLTLRRRRTEAAFWVFALVSFGPVSQVFPFLYPLADRYLYFILPGLVGAVLLALMEIGARLPKQRRTRAAQVALVLACALLAVFALRSHERARIWSEPALLLADAARHYPDGVNANLLRAKSAARLGDADAAVTALRVCVARGYNRYEKLLADPDLAVIANDRGFRQLIHEIAAGWIEAGRGWKEPTQMELRKLASAHAVRGERDEAIALLRRALDTDGPLDAAIRGDLGRLGARP